jgi:hypothetical protein
MSLLKIWNVKFKYGATRTKLPKKTYGAPKKNAYTTKRYR